MGLWSRLTPLACLLLVSCLVYPGAVRAQLSLDRFPWPQFSPAGTLDLGQRASALAIDAATGMLYVGGAEAVDGAVKVQQVDSTSFTLTGKDASLPLPTGDRGATSMHVVAGALYTTLWGPVNGTSSSIGSGAGLNKVDLASWPDAGAALAGLDPTLHAFASSASFDAEDYAFVAFQTTDAKPTIEPEMISVELASFSLQDTIPMDGVDNTPQRAPPHIGFHAASRTIVAGVEGSDISFARAARFTVDASGALTEDFGTHGFGSELRGAVQLATHHEHMLALILVSPQLCRVSTSPIASLSCSGLSSSDLQPVDGPGTSVCVDSTLSRAFVTIGGDEPVVVMMTLPTEASSNSTQVEQDLAIVTGLDLTGTGISGLSACALDEQRGYLYVTGNGKVVRVHLGGPLNVVLLALAALALLIVLPAVALGLNAVLQRRRRSQLRAYNFARLDAGESGQLKTRRGSVAPPSKKKKGKGSSRRARAIAANSAMAVGETDIKRNTMVGLTGLSGGEAAQLRSQLAGLDSADAVQNVDGRAVKRKSMVPRAGGATAAIGPMVAAAAISHTQSGGNVGQDAAAFDSKIGAGGSKRKSVIVTVDDGKSPEEKLQARLERMKAIEERMAAKEKENAALEKQQKESMRKTAEQQLRAAGAVRSNEELRAESDRKYVQATGGVVGGEKIADVEVASDKSSFSSASEPED